MKWKGRSVEEARWEDEDTMITQFPTFSLEDKTVWEEGIDRAVNGTVNE